MDKKCIACRVWRIHNDFIQHEAVLKTCKRCRDNQKRWRVKHTNYIKQCKRPHKVRPHKVRPLINPCLYIVYENEVITFD